MLITVDNFSKHHSMIDQINTSYQQSLKTLAKEPIQGGKKVINIVINSYQHSYQQFTFLKKVR